MTDEAKANYSHTMILAIRVLNRQITNLQYQLAMFADAANFVRINEVAALIGQRSHLDGALYAATQVIDNEHKEEK